MKLPSVVALLVTALLLAACGGDDDDVTPTPTVTATEVEPTATATSTPEPTQTPPPTVAPPTATPPPATELPPTPTSDPSGSATGAAIGALAQWLGPIGDPASITVASVEAVTWSNGCLELARPGQFCTLALVDGYRIILGLGNATYEVRTDATGSVTLWAPGTQLLASFQEASTNVLLFETDDGNELEAQAVPGTQFGVEVSALSPGDAVGLGLAEAPQRDGFLLVWLDPAD